MKLPKGVELVGRTAGYAIGGFSAVEITIAHEYSKASWQACRSETIRECVEIAESLIFGYKGGDDERFKHWDDACRSVAKKLREMVGE